MPEASEKLVEYMDTCHDTLMALTPLAVQCLMDVYKRFGVDGSSGIVGAEAPPDAALDASRFFCPRGTPLGATKDTTEI